MSLVQSLKCIEQDDKNVDGKRERQLVIQEGSRGSNEWSALA